MKKDLVLVVVAILLLFGYVYYSTGGHLRRVVVNSGVTTYYEARTYTKIVRMSTDSLGRTTYYETYVATYTKPGDYSTISLQFIASQPGNDMNRIEYNVYYVKDSTLSIHEAYNYDKLTSGTQTFPGGYFLETYITKRGNEYHGYIVGANAQTTMLDDKIASEYFRSYLSTINSIWSQLNFAPVMSVSFPYGVYYVTFPPEFYNSIYTTVDTPIHGSLILTTPYVKTFQDGGHATLPAGTYNVVYWFKVFGDKPDVITTTVTRTVVVNKK